LAFAVGAGAILQVIVEVGLLLVRRSARQENGESTAATAASGVVAGVAVMYATALLVQL
jgi:zinc transporter, ZIP family